VAGEGAMNGRVGMAGDAGDQPRTPVGVAADLADPLLLGSWERARTVVRAAGAVAVDASAYATPAEVEALSRRSPPPSGRFGRRRCMRACAVASCSRYGSKTLTSPTV
jgi:hypothetical protein